MPEFLAKITRGKKYQEYLKLAVWLHARIVLLCGTSYLNFHMCHQYCKISEVVTGACSMCLVCSQESTALC